MASRSTLSHYYDDAMLFALDEALRDVWQVLIAHNPYLTREADSELQTAVAETLIDLADSGIRNPNEPKTGRFKVCLSGAPANQPSILHDPTEFARLVVSEPPSS